MPPPNMFMEPPTHLLPHPFHLPPPLYHMGAPPSYPMGPPLPHPRVPSPRIIFDDQIVFYRNDESRFEIELQLATDEDEKMPTPCVKVVNESMMVISHGEGEDACRWHFTLPDGVDVGKIRARFRVDNGRLVAAAPKKQELKKEVKRSRIINVVLEAGEEGENASGK